MMGARLMRKVVAVWLLVGMSSAVAFAQDRRPIPPVLFADDFSVDTRADYVVDGPAEKVAFRDGWLSVSGGVTLVRQAEAAQNVVIEFELRAPKVKNEDQQNGTEFSIRTPLGPLVLNFNVNRWSVAEEYDVEIALTTAEPMQGRSWVTSMSREELSGDWLLRFADGQLEVTKDGEPHMRSFVWPMPWTNIGPLRIESRGAAVELNGITFRGEQVSPAERARLQGYAGRFAAIAQARAATADCDHGVATKRWNAALEGWPDHDPQTPFVAYVQLEAAVASIASGDVTTGMSKLQTVWPELHRSLDEDHPWRIGGEYQLRAAFRQLRSHVPGDGSVVALDEIWKAWQAIEWPGKASLAVESASLRKRWVELDGLGPSARALVSQFLSLSSQARRQFAAADDPAAMTLAAKAIDLGNQLKSDKKLEAIRSDLAELRLVSASAFFRSSGLDLQRLGKWTNDAAHAGRTCDTLQHTAKSCLR